jgi:hypothetical protein
MFFKVRIREAEMEWAVQEEEDRRATEAVLERERELTSSEENFDNTWGGGIDEFRAKLNNELMLPEDELLVSAESHKIFDFEMYEKPQLTFMAQEDAAKQGRNAEVIY